MRLAMKLASFPTTESQDRAALERKRNPIRDWRERTITEFRVLRKQTLRLTIDAIKTALEAPQMSAKPIATPSASVVAEDNDGAAEDPVAEQHRVSEDEVRGFDAPPAMGASKGAGTAASAGQHSEGAAAQRGAQGRGKRKPQVVVPLADADIGLQEPKFLKIETPSRSEL